MARQPPAVRRLIGLSGQYAAVDPFLTGAENLVMIGRLHGLDRRAARRRAAELAGHLDLAGVAFSWLNLLSGLAVRDPESAGLAGIFPVVILFFTSSVLVPVATMPGWRQAFAKANPITVITGALRALCLGGPTTRPVLEATMWLAALLAITIPAAIGRYRHATSN